MKLWWMRRDPGEIIATPWLHPAVIEYLEGLLEPHFRVIEHGSGGSTLWFSERVAHVVSIEFKPDWYERMCQFNLPNVKMIHWTEESALPKVGPKANLLLIDGEPVEDRALYMDECLRLVKPGGFVVLDNANRPEYARERERLGKRLELIKTFNGNDPGTKYLVTDFYRVEEDMPT